MKPVYKFLMILLTVISTFTAFAQKDDETIIVIEDDSDKSDTAKKKNSKIISISNDGFTLTSGSDTIKKEEKVFDVEFGMVDLGLNYISDKTDYNSAAARNFLGVNTELQNENLFSLREGKSVNVNVYPVMLKYRALKTKHQRIYISLGAGLQMYNFRFNKPVTYINETRPMVVLNDSLHFSKNKLGLTYLSFPLMVTAKTKVAKGATIVYGVGITGGYRIASWMKQVSTEIGKQKDHDAFNFNNFNSCVTAEFGLEGYFRLYASYQLTALHKDALQQYPYSIGFRLGGI